MILKAVAEGRAISDTKAEIGTGNGQSRVYEFRSRLENELREFLGEEAIGDAVRQPMWRGNIVARQEGWRASRTEGG